jgi:hypothetical protein
VGTELTRVEKTRRIAELEAAQRHLDVCTQLGDTNCTLCEKCLRTLLTLDLLGKADTFQTRFDLDEFRRRRAAFITMVWMDYKEDHCHEEIKDLMDEIGFRPGIAVQMRILATRAWRLLPAGLRKRLRSS